MGSQSTLSEEQEPLIASLLNPAVYPHPVARVSHIETHISHVLLAGDYAYKIKKPLNLGFLDFSSLEQRRWYCLEEIRLNRRLAPRTYLNVIGIRGSPQQPRLSGEGEPFEYAVRMRRFPQEALLSRIHLRTGLVRRIAKVAAAFHDRIPAAAPEDAYGSPEAVGAPMRQNFDHIRRVIHDSQELRRLQRLENWTQDQVDRLRHRLEQRRQQGRIRECHGDMHLGNMALVKGELIIFDGIEFNPALRWIDTISEVAFVVMDLEHRRRFGLARCFLDTYLEQSGDFTGLSLLPMYKVYRAMVRAKVNAIRLAQNHLGAEERRQALTEHGILLSLAESYVRPHAPAILITHGLSGSGKSRLAEILVRRLPAVRIRSDVERKRLFGLGADARTGSDLESGIYTPEATLATYGRLLELADQITGAGETLVVDATFLDPLQRQRFRQLAARKGLPFLVLSVRAPERVLRERLLARRALGADPSEAHAGVLETQIATQQPLAPEESEHTLVFDTGQHIPANEVVARCRAAMARGRAAMDPGGDRPLP